MSVRIHWFRKDLRVTDNPALLEAAKGGGRVVCVYILNRWQQRSYRWTGAMRQEFLCGSLASLRANMEALGGKLVIREGDAVDELLRLAGECGAEAIHYNRDVDPFGRAVESRLQAAAGRLEVVGHWGNLVHEPGRVVTAAGEPFRVYTPYSRAWRKLAKPHPLPRPTRLESPDGVWSLPLPDLGYWGMEREGEILRAGEKAARERLAKFLAGPVAHYKDRRDFLGEEGTSRISQDLRFGLLSPREVCSRVVSKMQELDAEGRRNAEAFLGEIIWREFYFSILWNWPEVLEQEFNPVFRGMSWPGQEDAFRAWCRAETGFPIVDAAMRQLLTTGFMHNRARMIVAMFLTKDLLVDWRLGESFFMQKLVDGEIASNNGGWQWSAGTGADAAPYFRIQNPWTQTARYDPEGSYIKKWLPELRGVPVKALCGPPAPGDRLVRNYPPPIVDHARARERALELFGSVKRRGNFVTS